MPGMDRIPEKDRRKMRRKYKKDLDFPKRLKGIKKKIQHIEENEFDSY